MLKFTSLFEVSEIFELMKVNCAGLEPATPTLSR